MLACPQGHGIFPFNQKRAQIMQSNYTIRDRDDDILESVTADTPQEAWDASPFCDKNSVCLDGELKGWNPSMGSGDLYAAFRTLRFSHEEAERALCVIEGRALSGALDEKKSAFVAKVATWPQAVRVAFWKKTRAWEQARNARIWAEVTEAIAREKLQAWLDRPISEEQSAKECAAEADEWWEREGKYENELEERGHSKYFHYENERRAQFGERPLSAREYLDA